MNFQARIDSDLKEALKAKQADKLALLRMLKSALQYAAIEKGGTESPLNDAEALAVIRKQVKQRQDSIAGFEKGHRPELAAKEQAELEILTQFLPQALSSAELEALVSDAIKESGVTSKAEMGKVMKLAQANADGRADGRLLSQEVQRQLSGLFAAGGSAPVSTA